MAGSTKDKNGKRDESVHYAPGDIVLGKIKGYPPWPGILCQEDSVPRQTVLSARPGKNYHIVRFFPAADYGFNRSHELRKLTRREIEAFLSDPHKRAADLREAYKLALDPEAWNEEQNDAVRQAEEEGDEEEDMLEGEEGDGEEEDGDQPVKKRKSTASANAARKSGASSSNKKAKVDSASASSTKASAAAQANKEKKISGSNAGAATSSPHKATPVDGEAEEELDPETKKVKSWRYALQHAFLPRTGQIHAEEMERHNGTFKQVEEYREITAKQLRLTKIGKVMKKIVELKSVPKDEDFHFRQRAQKLCDVWGHLLASGGVGSSSSGGKAKPESPVPTSSTPASKPTNGSLEAHAKAPSDDAKLAEQVGQGDSTEATEAQTSEGSNGAESAAKPTEGEREEAPPKAADSAPAAADESVLSQPPTKSDDQPVAV